MRTLLQDHDCYCMLFDTHKCTSFKDIQWLLYHDCEMSWKLSPWFCYEITLHTLFVAIVSHKHHYLV